MESKRPDNVGILAMEIYFPSTCVKQEALEGFNGVSEGKYTVGLGQECMSFCTDLEDVISMSLTAVRSVLDKYGVDPKDIGRLEVGTETIIDKSKAIKTWLMQLFEECGNSDIEGIDSTNACYGGTAALFNCVNWVESSSWDGRYGLVVSTDSAVYAEGAARPTGGAGAVAMLIGPNAPLALEPKFRGSHMAHAYDFYKPHLSSEYPIVEGMLSQKCYFMALDACYDRFCRRFEAAQGREFGVNGDADYVAFHSPYNKLVQKSFARLLFNDFKRQLGDDSYPYRVAKDIAQEKLEAFLGLSEEESYHSQQLQKVCQELAKPIYEKKVLPSTLLPKQVGNTYTASLYAALASLVHNKHHSAEDGQRVLMFSYGSGFTSTMFSIRIRTKSAHPPFTLSNIAHVMDVSAKLASRIVFPPEEYALNMKVMESRYGANHLVSSSPHSLLRPATFYLTHVDSLYRRWYARKPIAPPNSSSNSNNSDHTASGHNHVLHS